MGCTFSFLAGNQAPQQREDDYKLSNRVEQLEAEKYRLQQEVSKSERKPNSWRTDYRKCHNERQSTKRG